MAVPVQFANMNAEVARAEVWKRLNSEARGNEEWPPIAIKAAYVFGLIYDMSESVEWLLKHPEAWRVTYITGVATFLSSVELLGRCINGDEEDRGRATENLKTGLRYLFCSDNVSDQTKVVIVTNYMPYTISDIVGLRNYIAHGQATGKFLGIDIEFLDTLPGYLANALERYWNALQKDIDVCNKLAKANILPLRNGPVAKLWGLLEWDASKQKYHTMTEVFSRFDWQVNK